MSEPVVSAILRADCGGLGTLSRLFSHYMGFHRTLSIARIPGETADWHVDSETNRVVRHDITSEDVQWACEDATHLMSFEVWYGDLAPRLAREIGVKTVLLPNYECCVEDSAELRETDIAACATGLDLEVAINATPGLARAKKALTPIPCDVERIKFTPRTRAEVFIHRAGHQGDSGRNGTEEILKAWSLLKSPAKLLLYHQNNLAWPVPSNANIECRRVNWPNYWDQYASGEGDCLIHVTRHDALSLPIQEALTAGMPVVTARWWPHCDDGDKAGYLPPWCQQNAVAVSHTVQDRICRRFTSHRVKPEAVAEVVDRLYGTDISDASREARDWAEARAWDKLRGAWLEALSG